MTVLKYLIVIWLLCCTTLAVSQEFMPFAEAKITKKQWRQYRQEVIEAHGETEMRNETARLVIYNDASRRMSFSFTLRKHPAHPSWVTRHVQQDETGISVNQIGYFAGNEEEFAKLFRGYQELNQQISDKFRKEAQDP